MSKNYIKLIAFIAIVKIITKEIHRLAIDAKDSETSLLSYGAIAEIDKIINNFRPVLGKKEKDKIRIIIKRFEDEINRRYHTTRHDFISFLSMAILKIEQTVELINNFHRKEILKSVLVKIFQLFCRVDDTQTQVEQYKKAEELLTIFETISD